MKIIDYDVTEDTPENKKLLKKYNVKGYPTIILDKNGEVKELEVKPTKDNLEIYKKLRENNILFEDAKELANFINKRWNAIDSWWEDSKKKKLIDQYIELFQKDTDYLKEWKNFLRRIV